MAPEQLSDEALLDLVGEIYDCAIQPKKWPSALERIAKPIDGTHAAIALHNLAKQNFSLQVNWNVPPDFEKSMHEHLALNPFVPASWYVDIETPISAFRFFGFEEVKRTRWYKLTHIPFEHGDSALVLLARSANRFGSLSIHRRSWQPLFQDEELAYLRIIAPHVRRAVMISDMLGERTLERDMLAATLDRLAVGVMLLDESGRVLHANEAANELLNDASTLERSEDRLTATDPIAARDLAQAVASAARGTTIDTPRPGAVVSLRSRTGEHDAAWVLPLDSGLRREFAARFSAKVAVFIPSSGDSTAFPAELFVRRYAITPAECRVMVHLVQGMTPAEVADTLGITLATAKTHLARLFEKTGTSRQSDLVRLAMSALAPTSGR